MWKTVVAVALATSFAEAALPVFSVVKFPNDICTNSGQTRSGTCYTSEECESKGGKSIGDCAEGFGVCCQFIKTSCGDTANENCTYIDETSMSNMGSCHYEVCKLSGNDICRIRLDFESFTLAQPDHDATNADATAIKFGHCLTDTFTVTGFNNPAPPVICGDNSGQHMFIDTVKGDNCGRLNFEIGAGTAVSRSWMIKVTQYECGDEYAGHSGCLQYHTADSGSFESFNFGGIKSTTIDHLANQAYNICIRKNIDMCGICYYPDNDAAEATLHTYGISDEATLILGMGTLCTLDYLEIPGLLESTIQFKDTTGDKTAESGINKICGLFFNTDASVPATLCSRLSPFTVRFVTDETEPDGERAAPSATAFMGFQGFKLNYIQQKSC